MSFELRGLSNMMCRTPAERTSGDSRRLNCRSVSIVNGIPRTLIIVKPNHVFEKRKNK